MFAVFSLGGPWEYIIILVVVMICDKPFLRRVVGENKSVIARATCRLAYFSP